MKPLKKIIKSSFCSFVLISSALVIVYGALLQQDNLIVLIKARHTVRMQNRQIERYEREISALENRVEAISTDKDTLERYARERFRFAEPGDDVYIISGE